MKRLPRSTTVKSCFDHRRGTTRDGFDAVPGRQSHAELGAPAPQHVERHLAGELADAGAVADKSPMQYDAPPLVRKTHVDRPDRLGLAASIRPGNARYS